MAFECEAGKVLSNEEVATMLGYDDAKLARPDEYHDVVFDNTSGVNATYRCKTEDELAAEKKTGDATRKASEARVAARDAAFSAAGIDPATGGSTRPASFNTAHDLPPVNTDATRVADNDGENKPADTKAAKDK